MIITLCIICFVAGVAIGTILMALMAAAGEDREE